MRAIIVCVGYDDLLSLSLPRNAHHFEEIIVVTTPMDLSTYAVVANVENAMSFRTTAFHQDGAEFNKGRSLERALSMLGRDGWICHLDADVILPRKIDWPKLKVGQLYLGRRRICEDIELGAKLPEDQWEDYPVCQEQIDWPGFFQLFHADDPVLAQRPWYPTDWRHAGGADTEFNNKWSQEKRELVGFEVLHLGTPRLNWWGRQTPRLDGADVPGALESTRRMVKMDADRARHGYKLEKLP